MKAVGFHRFGGPEVLEVLDLPEPHAGRGEVRIKVTAAAVNPSDTVSRIADVLPIENASEAHRRLEAGGVRGRFVLTL